VAGFEHQGDAQRFLADLRERFAKFGLCYRPNSLTTTVVRSARIFEDRVDSATSLKTS
jgi:hypothetical protein